MFNPAAKGRVVYCPALAPTPARALPANVWHSITTYSINHYLSYTYYSTGESVWNNLSWVKYSSPQFNNPSRLVLLLESDVRVFNRGSDNNLINWELHDKVPNGLINGVLLDGHVETGNGKKYSSGSKDPKAWKFK